MAVVHEQFCAQNTAATCSFTPTSETAVDGPSHLLVTETNNGTEPAQLSATKGDDVSSTDSVELSATLGGSIVDAPVAGTCGHAWSTGHSFTPGVTNTVPAGYFGEITAIAPAPRHRQLHRDPGQHQLEPQRCTSTPRTPTAPSASATTSTR